VGLATARQVIRVLIVDDHVMFTELLSRRLSEQGDLEVVGWAVDASSALDQVARLSPSVVVIDYRLPGTDGVTLAAELTANHPGSKLVMLTGDPGPDVVAEAVAAGCVGYIGKDRPADEIIEALRAAARGESRLSHADLSRLARPRGPHKISTLTTRETAVLQGLADGMSTRRLATALHMSVNTARNHAQSILQKLGAHSRLEAVAIARRRGLIISNTIR
jgi:DNA-binding NarL/FixJ family response regulator